jgi:phytoene synthase
MTLDHPAQFLRDTDRDRYLATLVLPPAARPAITALFAFAADCAAIRSRVSEPAPGEIRLQWWADALTGEGHGNVVSNPLAASLLDAIAHYRLPIVPLLRLVNARRFDLYDDPMPDTLSFEGYAGETVSVLHQLAAMILNDGNAVEPGDAAGHLGVAYAMVGHLRAFGYHASSGRLFLPLSVFKAHGVIEAEIYTGARSDRLTAAMAQLHEMAEAHLIAADAAIAALPRTLRPAFAAAALLPAQLRLLPPPATPFTPPAEFADWRKIGRLLLWSLRQR